MGINPNQQSIAIYISDEPEIKYNRGNLTLSNPVISQLISFVKDKRKLLLSYSNGTAPKNFHKVIK